MKNNQTAHQSIIEKINEASLKFLLPLSPEDVYKTIVHEAVNLVDASYGSIILQVDGELKRVYSSSELGSKTINRLNGNTQKAFATGKVIAVSIDETEKFHPELKKFGITSTMFVPLSYQGKAVGVLTINSKKKLDESAEETRILQLFGSMASLAIRKTQMYDETKQALEVRDLFISLASHELRTPLTSINGYIQLLYSRMGTQESSEGNWVRELYEESKRLTNLVQELLEINRIKQGQLQFILREIHFLEIVTKATQRSIFIHPERKIVLESNLKDSEGVVIGDAEKLLQVVTALLENAIKFSPNESEVKVVLSNKNNTITLQVTDQGLGIAREDMIHIFEGFYKGHDNHQEGMGVGLLLAKHIINYHHGSISVHSEIKKGTTVTVTLPQATL